MDLPRGVGRVGVRLVADWYYDPRGNTDVADIEKYERDGLQDGSLAAYTLHVVHECACCGRAGLVGSTSGLVVPPTTLENAIVWDGQTNQITDEWVRGYADEMISTEKSRPTAPEFWQ